MTSMTLCRILCQQLPKVSAAAKTMPTTASSATPKRNIHNVTLPWPSTPSEAEMKMLDVEFLHQAAKSNPKPNTSVEDLQTTIKDQTHQLLQREKNTKQLKSLITQPGFQTQKKWVYECKTCGEVGVGVGVEIKGKGKSRLMKMLERKEGMRERYDVS